MAKKETEQNITGLDQAIDRKEAEYDLASALLSAAEFRTAEENITEVDIKRNGKFYFSVHIHPISDADVKQARKQAGIYKDNPTNKKLGKVKVDVDDAKFGSWLIYMATTPQDQQKIWNNSAIMQKYSLMQPWESVDVLLITGEKNKLLETVFEISGINDEGDEEQDEEFFQ